MIIVKRKNNESIDVMLKIYKRKLINTKQSQRINELQEFVKPSVKKRKKKHIPQRTCVGCRTVQAKRAMTRIVRTPTGTQIDTTGKLAGRGAYLHNTKKCWELGLKGSLARALKIDIIASDQQKLSDFMATLPNDETAM